MAAIQNAQIHDIRTSYVVILIEHKQIEYMAVRVGFKDVAMIRLQAAQAVQEDYGVTANK